MLRDRYTQPPLKGTVLVVDQTGVGKPVINLLRDSKAVNSRRLVTIVAGPQSGLDGYGGWLLPKKDLVGQLQVLLQNRCLKIPQALPDAGILCDELNQFKMKPQPLSESVEISWRERPHDDLVLALALACWEAERASGMAYWLEDRERYPELYIGGRR